MSLKARLLLLMVGSVLLISMGVSAVHLNGLVSTWLEAAKERADIAAQQAKGDLTISLSNKPFPAGVTASDIKRGWSQHASADQQLTTSLQRTMAQSRGLVEISISDQTRKVVVSTDPNRLGEPLKQLTTLESVIHSGAISRFVAALRGRSEYECTTALGFRGEAEPVFLVQVVVSSVLLQDTLIPQITQIVATSGSAVLIAVALSLLATGIAMRPMERINQALDRISQGNPDPGSLPAGLSTKEFAVVKSKLDLLGEQVRGARQLVEKLDDAIVVVDRDQRVTLVGDAAERLLGVRRDELRGKTLEEVFPVATELGMTLRNAFRLQVPVENRTVTWKSANGKGSVRLTINAEAVGAGNPGSERTGMIVTLRDPEGRKQVQSQLDLADRLASISRLTSGVTHEIKNPLNAIALRLEVLRGMVEADVPSSKEEIDIISHEVRRLDRVVKTFLDFTRPVNLKLVDVELMDVLRDIVRFLQPEVDAAGVQIHLASDGGPFPVRVDQDLMKQAFLNIIRNGVESMANGSGGSLRIRVEESMLSAPGSQCLVTVSDTGSGIPEEHRDRIFQLYFSTKKNGTGLGLAMAFRAVQLHGGRLEFTSEIGKGTTFLFILPTTDRGAVDPRPPQAGRAAAQSSLTA